MLYHLSTPCWQGPIQVLPLGCQEPWTSFSQAACWTPRKHLNGALPTGCAQLAQHMVKLSTLPKKLSSFHRIASWQTGDQLYMLLMMLGVGRRRWTTRQNTLHQC